MFFNLAIIIVLQFRAIANSPISIPTCYSIQIYIISFYISLLHSLYKLYINTENQLYHTAYHYYVTIYSLCILYTVSPGYVVAFNATEYEFDVNVYSPNGTVVFEALLFAENPSSLYLFG